ncbi:MAG TPA: hypothetical protein H9830_02035 [Candidatus Agrococcus pullicola]|uniref:Uncharacterized protein n=1 Tax=Candidatus Agrococcus pullicola TaxID=2838429 RepID=A0A9D2C897_9MICO|nr:hypothetical protein [Candidatus Agrococcus pullicola]
MSDQAREWILTVDDQHLDRLDEIVAALESAGLYIDRVLTTLGQIAGHTDAEDARDAISARASFAAVTGISTVDAVQHFGVAPPDEEVQ